MKKNCFLMTLLLFVCCKSFAQQMRMLSSVPENLEIQNTSKNYTSLKKAYNGLLYEDFNLVSNIKMLQEGAPELPVFSESLVIPNVGATSIEVTYDSYEELDNINILPSKGSLKRNVNPVLIPYNFGTTYTTDAFFPGKLAETAAPFIFRNTRGITVTFYPYQYNPITKKLRIYKNIRVKLITDASQLGQNEKQQRNVQNDVFQSFYNNLFLNETGYSPLNDNGEMLIIMPTAFSATIQPLVNWKLQSGLQTTVVSLTTTGNTPEAIKNYITNAYFNNPNLVYVMLVGDHEDLPAYSYGSIGNELLWSDSYYGQIEGTDFFPEIIVGRLSGNVAEIAKIVDKIIDYEASPIDGNWMTNAIGIGSNEGYGYGDDGEADWQHLRNIGNKLTSFGYNNIFEFYEASQGENDADYNPTPDMITEAINDGVGLLNYTGHGALEIMSTGDYTLSDLDDLTNTGSFPFVISVACNNGTFVGSNSICEGFLKASYDNQPTGAIASCGSSILMAWAEPMQTQDEMTELIVKSNTENIKKSLGGLFYNGQISMLEAYNQSTTAQEVMQTWVFFGDPSVLFRSTVPTTITATHEAIIQNSGGILNIFSNTGDAKVTVLHENEIIASGFIEEGTGTAVLEIPELISMDPLKVTITKQNTTPYRGTVTVTDNLSIRSFENQFAVFPNPADDFITIRNSGSAINNAHLKITDMNGRVLLVQNNINLGLLHTIAIQTLASGIYFLVINDGINQGVAKIVIR